MVVGGYYEEGTSNDTARLLNGGFTACVEARPRLHSTRVEWEGEEGGREGLEETVFGGKRWTGGRGRAGGPLLKGTRCELGFREEGGGG